MTFNKWINDAEKDSINPLATNGERTLFYAGIGSRKTPDKILRLMTLLSIRLSNIGFVLRSGGANGADTAFEIGASKKEIYLPWAAFNSSNSKYCNPSLEAIKLAEIIHPAWHSLANAPRKLMARNCHQILGCNLRSPSDFVICWTPDGAEKSNERSRSTGGTGQAIDLADRLGIPVFNLKNDSAINRLSDYIKSSPYHKEIVK